MVDIESLSDDEQKRVRGLVEKGCRSILPNDAFDGLSEDAYTCFTESMEEIIAKMMTGPGLI